MGAKVINITLFLGSISILLQIIGLNLPLHTVSWFTLTLVRIFRMKTYALSVGVTEGSNDFCKLIETMKPGWCDGLYDSHDLQDVAQKFCAPIIVDFVPSACIGLSRAHIAGLSLVIVTSVNIILVLISCWLFFDYINGKRKARRRILAYGLLSVAVGVYVVALVVYAVLVILQLDQMQPKGGKFVSMLLSANRGTGISGGFIILCSSAIVQIAMMIMSAYAGSGDELTDDMIEDLKMEREVKAEWEKAQLEYGLAAHGSSQPMGGGYGAVGYGAYGGTPSAPPVSGPQSFNGAFNYAQQHDSSSFGLPPAHGGAPHSGW